MQVRGASVALGGRKREVLTNAFATSPAGASTIRVSEPPPREIGHAEGGAALGGAYEVHAQSEAGWEGRRGVLLVNFTADTPAERETSFRRLLSP